jgi:predicted restriction endonuclease
LRASHIKPWRASSDKERLDVDNGILLTATLDSLFDVGLISFSDDGSILISNNLESPERKKLGISEKMTSKIKPTKKMQEYLKFHRNHILQSSY